MGELIPYPKNRRAIRIKLKNKWPITSIWNYDTLRRIIDRTRERKEKRREMIIAARREEIARRRIKKMQAALKRV